MTEPSTAPTVSEVTDMRWEPRYRDHLLGEGLAERTVDLYVRKMRRVEEWCLTHDAHPTSMTAQQVLAMSRTFPQSFATLGQVRAALKHYWLMIGRYNAPYRAIRLPREDEPPPKPLETDEARALVKTAMGWWPEGTAVLAGLYLALRRETIAKMRWDGFDEAMDWYRFDTKRSKVLTRPVHPILRAELVSRPTAYVWLFPGRTSAHIHPATIGDWVDRVASAAGLGHVATHRLRHTALTEMNDRTKDLRVTAEFAGHSKISTTKRYTRVRSQHLTEAVMALDYLGDQ